VDLNLMLLEQARLHLSARRAAHDLAIARAVLNVELGRAPDASMGAPSETVPMIATGAIDDLLAQAMHTRQILAHNVPEHVVRGEVAVALRRMQHLAESWRVMETEAIPPALALLQNLSAAYTAGQLSANAVAEDARLAFQTELDRNARFAEIFTAAAELEWVVGAPLQRATVASSSGASAAPAASSSSGAPR
jgi:hypothetical protein